MDKFVTKAKRTSEEYPWPSVDDDAWEQPQFLKGKVGNANDQNAGGAMQNKRPATTTAVSSLPPLKKGKTNNSTTSKAAPRAKGKHTTTEITLEKHPNYNEQLTEIFTSTFLQLSLSTCKGPSLFIISLFKTPRPFPLLLSLKLNLLYVPFANPVMLWWFLRIEPNGKI